MESRFWHDRWEENRIGFHQNEINTHLQSFWPRLNLWDSATIFVPLCGKSRDLLWLRSRGYRVLGIEISPIAVRDFFDENRLIPEISRGGRMERWQVDGLTVLCGDFFDLTSDDLKQCRAIYDRASLIALPPKMREKYAEHLNHISGDVMSCLLVTMEYDQQQMSGPPFSVREQEVQALYADSFQMERLFSIDVLQENPNFASKGLTALMEKVYLLHR